jgi:beta-aspartyl-peptidase (threonine type)
MPKPTATTLLALLVAASAQPAAARAAAPPVAIVVHGGAGTMNRAELTPEREAAIRADLEQALRAGHAVLAAGGTALDAVTQAVLVLEDSPRFNAGRGAVFTAEGTHELDAAVMTGPDRRAGAVAGLRHVRNPILLARAVMEKSPHVMLIGDGAEAFAKSVGLAMVDNAWFSTPERREQLDRAREREAAAAAPRTSASDGDAGPDRREPRPAATTPNGPTAAIGTVGAVALDVHGHLAAATSTGGMTNKRWGRVGDVPVLGAGTYANDACAVSATGWGEFYIRATAAHDLCARVAYRGDSLAAAADEVVLRIIPAMGGSGGVIALDRQGNLAMPFSTSGMYRGAIDTAGRLTTAIFAEPTAPAAPATTAPPPR